MRSISLTVCFLFCISMANPAFDYVITDGDILGTVTLYNNESLLMTGGGVNRIDAEDFSYIEVWGTAPLKIDVGGIYDLNLDDNSTMNFYNGELGLLDVYDNGRVVFEGGRIDYISSYQRPLSGDWPPSYWDKHIEIICKDWSWNELTNLLTGTWADDTAFSIQLVDQTGYYPAITNIEFTIIPEPATLTLLAIGAVFLKKKR